MPRDISAGYRYSTHSVFSDDVDLVFLTISHETISDPIRVVRDTKEYVRDGVTWSAFWFDIELLTDEDSAPTASLSVQNVDLRIGEALQELRSPARVQFELFSSDDFDLSVVPRVPIGTPEPEYIAPHLYLANVKLDAMNVSGQLVGWDYSQRAWPGVRATQNRLPGLFR